MKQQKNIQLSLRKQRLRSKNDGRITQDSRTKCRIEYINKLESLEDINQYLEDKDYLVYIITLSGISFGEFRNYQFKLIEDITKLDRLEELRIFDKERELHIWRQSDGKGGSVLKGRLRIDNPIEEAAQCYYRDAKQLLLGQSESPYKMVLLFLKKTEVLASLFPILFYQN